MAILKVTYGELSFASKNAKNAARETESYASKLERGVARKIGSISGGGSSRTEAALSETWLKIKELKEKSNKLNSYAKKVESFESTLRETDKRVAKRIESLSANFAKGNGFKLGKVSAFFKSLAVGVFNSSALGRWTKDVYNKVGDKVNEWKTEIRHWFRTGGGKYVGDIIWSGIVLCAAITTIFTLGSAFLVGTAIIAAVIAFIDLASNIVYTVKAINQNDKDPAWAHRYGKTNTLADSLRLEGQEKAASVVDIIDSGTSLILVGASLLESGKKLALKSKSIKNLFGNKNRGLGKKFFVKVRGKQVFNFKKGLKSIIKDKEFRKRLAANFKKDLGKDKRKFIRYLKNKKGIIKQVKLKGVIKRAFKSELKQYKEAYKKINAFDGTPKADILKKLLKDGKLSKKSTKILKTANKIKFAKDNGENLLKGKIKIKYYDDVIKLIDKANKVKVNMEELTAH